MSTKQVIANIEKLKIKTTKEIEKAIDDVVLDLQGKSQRLAPIDTGDLRGSASSEVRTTMNRVVGEVGFNMEYALKQHEDLTYNHPRGGQAKYLETPLKENQSKYKRDIEEAMRRALK